MDQLTQQGLPFASVLIKGSNTKGTTDGHGHFAIDNLCPGPLEIQVHHLACEGKTFSLSLKNSLDTTLLLDHKSIDLDVVDINHKHNGENFAGHSNVISADQLNGTFGDGLGGISKKIPSLSFSSGGVGTEKPTINGLGGSRVGIIYNQTALKYQQWGGEHASSVSFFAGDNIEVIDELGALKYGSEAFGGAVIIKDASIFDQKTPLNLTVLSQFQSNPAGGKINIKSSGHLHQLGELFYKVGVEQSQFAAANTATGFVSNTARNSNNYFAHIGKKIKSYSVELSYIHSNSTQGIYSGSHISNISDLRLAISNSENRNTDNTRFTIASPKIEEVHELMQFTVKRAINKGEITFDASRQINLRKEFDSHGRGTPSTQLSLANQNIGIHGKWFHKNTLYSVGASLQNENNIFNFSRVIPDYSMLNAGFYAGAKHYFKNSYLTAGFRAEWYDITPGLGEKKYAAIDSVAYSDLAWSGILAYHFTTSKVQHQLQVAHNFRFPNAFELYAKGIHHGSAEYVEGNTSIKTEKAHGFSYRAKFQDKKWSIEFNPFVRLYTNYILSQPTGESVLTISGAFPRMEVQNQDINTVGFNLHTAYQAHKKLSIKLTANRVFNFQRQNKKPVYGIDPGRADVFLNYSAHKHINVEYNMEYSYGAAGGTPYSLEGEDVEKSTAAILHHTNISFSKWEAVGIKVKLGLHNIFNTEFYRYTNASRIFYPELGRNVSISILYHPKHKQHEH